MDVNRILSFEGLETRNAPTLKSIQKKVEETQQALEANDGAGAEDPVLIAAATGARARLSSFSTMFMQSVTWLRDYIMDLMRLSK